MATAVPTKAATAAEVAKALVARLNDTLCTDVLHPIVREAVYLALIATAEAATSPAASKTLAAAWRDKAP